MIVSNILVGFRIAQGRRMTSFVLPMHCLYPWKHPTVTITVVVVIYFISKLQHQHDKYTEKLLSVTKWLLITRWLLVATVEIKSHIFKI